MSRASAVSGWLAAHCARLSVVAACVVLVVGLLVALAMPVAKLRGIRGMSGAYDITIVRCAARTIRYADPYRVEPLAACERKSPMFAPDSIAPAPQPPYLLLAFEPFARLSGVRFSFAWSVAIIASFLVASGLLARMSRIPWLPIFGCLMLGPGYENLVLGQLSALVVLGVAAASYALARERPRLAALALAPALAEPHVALPAYLALFVLVPRSRLTIALLGAVVLALSVAATGVATAWEYVTAVLPLQALSEIPNADGQYSLTTLAAAFGASDVLAVRFGEFQYVVFALGAIVLANRLRTRFDDPAFVVALPAAVAVIGGPFVHYSETLALFPALLLLMRHAAGRARIIAIAAIALYAVPWHVGDGLRFGSLACLAIGIIVWILLTGFEQKARIAIWAAISVPTLGFFLLVHQLPDRVLGAIATSRTAFLRETAWASSLAGVDWGLNIRAHYNVVTSFGVLVKIPTLTAYLLLAVLLIAALRTRTAQAADPQLTQ